jgi:hypothetical protein
MSIRIRADLGFTGADGTKLHGRLYLPDARVRHPAVTCVTPYGVDRLHATATYFANSGMAFAAVDARGRGDSEGVFGWSTDNVADAGAIIDQIGAQDWCSGRVAAWGMSYQAALAWMAAIAKPRHLSAIVSIAAVHPGIDFPGWRGIRESYLFQWLALTNGKGAQWALFEDGSYWKAHFARSREEGLSFRDMGLAAGLPPDVLDWWLAHPAEDSFWQPVVPSRSDYASLDCPVLTITGHYDTAQPGALSYWKRHRSNNSGARHHLIMGPWAHADTRNGSDHVGTLALGPNAAMPVLERQLSWLDWILRDGVAPDWLGEGVSYYVAGADLWCNDVDLQSPEHRKYHLAVNEQLALVAPHHALDLELRASFSSSVPAGDLTRRYETEYLIDDVTDASIWNDPQTLRFLSSRLSLSVVAGSPLLELEVRSAATTFDLQAIIYEVTRDGHVLLLAHDLVRIANPSRAPQQLRMDGFNWFARQLAEDSSLGLALRIPNTIFLESNRGFGGDIASEAGEAEISASLVSAVLSIGIEAAMTIS